MKILNIITKDPFGYKRGGAEKFVLLLKRFFFKKKYNIGIMAPFEKKYNNKYFYKINVIKNIILRKLLLDYLNIFQNDIINRIKIIDPDIIHIHTFYGLSIYSIRKISELYPVMITIHDVWIIEYSQHVFDFINKLHSKLVFKILKNILLIVPTRFIYQKLKKIGYKNIKLIPHGIEIKKNITNYKNFILFVGRICKEKGLHTIIDVLNDINNYNVIILGEGPMKEKLEKKYRKINFLGYQLPDKYYKKASFLVLPSIVKENFPLSIIEAMSYGICVVASNIGGIPEIIKHNKTGILFKPGDAKDFEEKINYLIENPSEIKRIGKNAKKFVEKNFSIEKMINNYEKVYKEVYNKFKKEKQR